MKRDRLKENQNNDYLGAVIIFGLVFLISFLVFYFLTREYILRHSAVSIKEEASKLTNYFNEKDLNNLYLNQQIDKDEVIILGYHQIRNTELTDTEKEKLFITPPEIFEQEMKYLFDHGYMTITITQYLKYLQDPIQNKISKPAIILTFDDGYRTQFANAYPILKKYNFTSTFFIYADCIDKYPICLTSEELTEMVNHGMRLGNHTEHHIALTEYKDKTIKKEIKDNQKFLEKFGQDNLEKIIAYPYGLVDERVEKIVKDLGYVGGLGVSFYAKEKNNLYNLPRYLQGDNIQNFYDLFKK